MSFVEAVRSLILGNIVPLELVIGFPIPFGKFSLLPGLEFKFGCVVHYTVCLLFLSSSPAQVTCSIILFNTINVVNCRLIAGIIVESLTYDTMHAISFSANSDTQIIATQRTERPVRFITVNEYGTVFPT